MPDVSRELVTAPEPVKKEDIAKIDPRDAFYGLPRAAEVSAVLEHGGTRRTVSTLLKNKSAGKDVWDLLLWSIDPVTPPYASEAAAP